MEKCHNQNPNSSITCRLNKGHKGNHKWWTSIGNAFRVSWDNQNKEE